MKKFLIGLVFLFMFAVALPIATNAQQCNLRQRNVSRSYYNNTNYDRQNRNYYGQQRRGNRVANFFRNRNVRNIALASGGGAIIGGVLGGNRKSIAKGAIVGAGAGALYTYILRPKRGYR